MKGSLQEQVLGQHFERFLAVSVAMRTILLIISVQSLADVLLFLRYPTRNKVRCVLY